MAPRKTSPLVARETFTCEHDGERVVVLGGQTIASTHPLVKGREALFDPVDQIDHEAPTRG